MKKRVLYLLIAACLIASLIPAMFITAAAEATTVAEVNGVQYESLQEAINAANGDTVKLLADITTDATFTIPEGISITLDMNGKKITATDKKGAKTCYEIFYIYGDMVVTGNGTIELTAETDRDWGASSTIFHNRGGVLVIENGTFTHKGGSDMAYVVDNNANSYGDATTTINGGALTSTYIGIRNRMDTYGANGGGNGIAKLIVNGGTISGKYAVWGQVSSTGVKGEIIITNGSLNALEGRAALIVDEDTTGEIKVAVSGGQFTSPVAANFCAAGYVPVEISEGVYGVTKASFVAEVNGVQYESLQAAINAANGETVALLKDVVLESAIVIAKDQNVTIDLGSFDITLTSTIMGESMITNYGVLTINGNEDAVINYNYVGEADPTYGIGNYTINNLGTLTVNGGKITIANLRAHAKYPINNYSANGDAVLVINGGHLYNYNTSAIRQICSTGGKNIITINGGLIEGYCAIWVQNPGKGIVHAELNITGGEIRTTAAAYVNGTAALKDVSSSLYFTLSDANGAWTSDSVVNITGGTFNENVNLVDDAPKANIGVGATFNGNLVRPINAVAEVDGIQYESLQAAINAANGETVKLLADITTDATFTVADGISITLDMNGKKITATDKKGAKTSYEIFYIYGGMVVTGNGTIELTAETDRDWDASSTIFHNRGGVLVIENGTFTHKGGSDMAYVVDNNANSYGDATTTINGSTLTSTYVGIRNRMDTYGANGGGNGIAKLIINGGTISGKRAVWGHVSSAGVKGEIIITNGTLNAWEGEEALRMGTDATGEIKVAVSGGQFTSPVAANFCATGYVPTEIAEGVYGVALGSFVAEIDGVKYLSLQAAVEAAEFGDTIVVLDDIILEAPVVIAKGQKITLELGSFDITLTSTTMGESMITNNGELIINGNEDAVINYNYVGEADPSYGYGNYTINNLGTLTVNGGKITIANLRAHAKYPINNYSANGDAVLVINGGHLYNYNTSAIRQICSTGGKNIITINGGLIEGYCAIWVQNPGKSTVHAELNINGGEIRTTAAAYVNGTAELKDVASRLYFTIDGEGGAWTEDSIVNISGGIFNENVNLVDNAPKAIIGADAIFNGNLNHIHSFGDWTQTKAPSCTGKGELKRVCNCGYSETQEVAALGHTFVGVYTEPTLEADGYTTYTCHCGSSYVQQDVGSKLVNVNVYVDGSTIVLEDVDGIVNRVGVIYIGKNAIDGVTEYTWSQLVALGQSGDNLAVNGQYGYKSYTDLNNLPQLTENGYYVLYAKYTTADVTNKNVFFTAEVSCLAEIEVPVITVENGEIQFTGNPDRIGFFYLGEEKIEGASKLPWATLVSMGRENGNDVVNGKYGYMSFTDLENLPKLGKNGFYVFYAKYQDENGNLVNVFYEIEVDDLAEIKPPVISVENGQIKFTNNPVRIGFFYLGEEKIEGAAKLPWATLVNMGLANGNDAVNGKYGYMSFTDLQNLPKLNKNGFYVFYAKYQDENGKLVNVFYEIGVTDAVEASVPVVSVENGKILVTGEAIRVGFFYLGTEPVEGATEMAWKNLVALGTAGDNVAVNGKYGYKSYTDLDNLPELTAEGYYVVYAKYTDENGVQRNIFYNAQV